eukprot:1157009-Pelagomonas_calceolata.AAC.9
MQYLRQAWQGSNDWYEKLGLGGALRLGLLALAKGTLAGMERDPLKCPFFYSTANVWKGIRDVHMFYSLLVREPFLHARGLLRWAHSSPFHRVITSGNSSMGTSVVCSKGCEGVRSSITLPPWTAVSTADIASRGSRADIAAGGTGTGVERWVPGLGCDAIVSVYCTCAREGSFEKVTKAYSGTGGGQTHAHTQAVKLGVILSTSPRDAQAPVALLPLSHTETSKHGSDDLHNREHGSDDLHNKEHGSDDLHSRHGVGHQPDTVLMIREQHLHHIVVIRPWRACHLYPVGIPQDATQPKADSENQLGGISLLPTFKTTSEEVQEVH